LTLSRRLFTALFAILASGILSTIYPQSAVAQGVAWSRLSLDEALARAAKSNQLVFVDVHAEHCGPCGQMNLDIWPTPEAAAIVRDMVTIRIDTDSAEGKALEKRYPIMGLPVALVLDADGREISRVVGYYNRGQWLRDAAELGSGVDPIGRMEAEVAANSKSLIKTAALLETYLHRQRVEDAEALLPVIVELDEGNRARRVEKAFVSLAKYYDYFLGDSAVSDEYWTRFVESYPGASSIGQGIKATFEHARRENRLEEWGTWMCSVAEKNPTSGRLHYSIASWANRGGLRSDCLAESAWKAYDLGVGSFMDSIAVVLAEN